jgi:hypothetical protein
MNRIPVGSRVRIKLDAPNEDKRVVGRYATLDSYKNVYGSGAPAFAQLKLDKPCYGKTFWLALPESLELVP